MRSSMSSVGLMIPFSMRVIVVWEMPARFATAYMDNPNTTRFSRRRLATRTQTASLFDFATPYEYGKKGLTCYVHICTSSHRITTRGKPPNIFHET
jgi:hypothetical protein